MSNAYDLTGQDSGFDLIPKGKYEVIAEKIDIKQFSTGTEYIHIHFRIRDDIEQEYSNRVIFERIFKEKGTEIFNRRRLTSLLKACIKEPKLNYDGIEEILETIVGSKLVINVGQRHDEYWDEDENYVSYYEPTQHGDKLLGSVNAPAPESPKKELKYEDTTLNVEEDDLPF